MARPQRADRQTIAESSLTLRLTREDKELLEHLVAMRAAELAEEGIVPTAASYVRGLIRREAAARGLATASTEKMRSSAPMRAARAR